MKKSQMIRDSILLLGTVMLLIWGIVQGEPWWIVRGCLYVTFAISMFLRDKSQGTSKAADALLVLSVAVLLILDVIRYR